MTFKEKFHHRKYLLACIGADTYFAEIVPGYRLLDTMLIAMFEKVSDCPKEEKMAWQKQLYDSDNWGHSNGEPVTFSADIGEDGHFDIFMVT